MKTALLSSCIGKPLLRTALRSIVSTSFASIERLKQRALHKISGADTNKFLQGMVTNDMQVFEKPENKQFSLYSLLLNNHGRVLYDCIIYKLEDNVYLLEHDATANVHIKKHLDIFKLRKKVIVVPMPNLCVWVGLKPNETNNLSQNNSKELGSHKDILISIEDPRLPELGYRLITATKDVEWRDLLPNAVVKNDDKSYSLLRYKLGIGEGVIDHPPGSCIPFETNVDLLNGVSFQKGCYIGQELTARLHFTGVVRKRLMPITLSPDEELQQTFAAECSIINEKAKKVGKYRHHIGKQGLAVLNVEEALSSKTLTLKDYDVNITTSKPDWWKDITTTIKHGIN